MVSTGIDTVLRIRRDGSPLEMYVLGELPSDERELLGIAERRIDRRLPHYTWRLINPQWWTVLGY